MMKAFRILPHLALPLFLCVFNGWLWPHLAFSFSVLGMLYGGMAILAGLVCASGVLRPAVCRAPDGLAAMAGVAPAHGWWPRWVLVATWAAAWCFTWVWLLPSGGLLRLLAAPVFVVLVWHGLDAKDDTARLARRMVGWIALALLVLAMAYLAASSWHRERMFSVVVGPLNVQGLHYDYGQVVKTWRSLHLLGPAFPDQPGTGLWGEVRLPSGERLLRAHEMELLKLMIRYGILAGMVAAVSLLLGWTALWSWVRRLQPSPLFSAGARRLTLALVFLHTAAAWGYVLFNMGVIRVGGGAGLPLVSISPAWWPSNVALLVMLGLAVRAWRAQRAVGQVTPSGKSPWVTAVGYVLAGLALGVVLLWAEEVQREYTWNWMHQGQ